MTAENLADGRQKVREHAKELWQEAKILRKANHNSRAYTLAHLAMEELARLFLLFGAELKLIAGDELDTKLLEKQLRSHKLKVMQTAVITRPIPQNLGGPAALSRVRQAAKEVEMFNGLKNDSLYVGLSRGEFKKPTEVITAKLADATIKFADSRLESSIFISIDFDRIMEQVVSEPKLVARLRRQLETASKEGERWEASLLGLAGWNKNANGKWVRSNS